MFDKIYTFASNEYGGKMFAQRFRSQWKDQIDFFVGKGFEITGRSPIYGLDVKKWLTLQTLPKEVKVENEFHFDSFLQAAVKNQTYQQEELAMLQEYYQSVDFDFSVACYEDEELSGYFGVTFREDNKYAEIIASGVNEEEDFIACLQSTVEKLRELGAEVVGIHESSLPDNARKEAGFEKISEDVMLMKKL
ncbi:hypothetical protein LC065_13425 [Halobacillus litoralis]|uniref:hypothetical protein n=1 Tax=Halobacillus litoralis TaxID=45668 RepID=UPI0027402E29|nr:hypothetical protein [Halobacillus litoralis]WLR46568.1 hypothetical protein LC065_13425 [Halobacillus litoralis]